MSKNEEQQSQPSQKEQQYDQLISQLRNPDYVKQLAEQAGLKLQQPKEETLEAPQPPEITEEMSVAQITKLYSKYALDLQKHNEKLLELRLNKQANDLRGEVTKSKEQEDANKIRKFAASKSDFNKYLPDIDALYVTGRYTIEEAYEKAKQLAGVVEPEKKEGENKSKAKKPSEEPQPKKRSSIKSDDNIDEDIEPAKKTVKETAKTRLTELLKEKKLTMPIGKEDITAEEEPEAEKED